ncbi:S41 family peptidase [Flavobacterium akiainvivens]|nr:S41 family peptidase [Flavobacterium akiainvivens]SFQ63187.1 Peptidase family S41 [Flavobacterium akiainvivens]
MRLLALFLLFTTAVFAKPNDTAKYKTFGLVWGFLKYHHPEISKGKQNWDAEFIKQFNTLETLGTTDEINSFYKTWINSYGPVADVAPKTYGNEYFTQNEDYRWFEASGFDDGLKSLLLKIKNGKHTAANYYVKIPKLTDLQDFSNEKGFEGFDVKLKSHRLLNLFSFWNVTQYWNLNKYLFDEDWLTVLDKSLPDFIAADTQAKMDLAKARLYHHIQDSHCWFMTDEIQKTILPTLYPPFWGQDINDSIVITGTPSKPLLDKTGIALGDVITAVNGKPVKQALFERVGQYLSYGNEYRLRERGVWLLRSASEYDTYTVVGKDATPRDVRVQQLSSFEGQLQREDLPAPKTAFPDDVAYLWMGTATKADLKKFFKDNANKKGVILDMRNYPDKFTVEDLSGYLYPEKRTFAVFMAPTKTPGIAEKNNQAALGFIDDPLAAGSSSKNYYKGKVILLVDNHTISQSEFMGMCVQAAPNCTTVGTPTAGVVANVVQYTLPDKSTVDYTGYQAFYPDGTVVFKKGLKIDIPVGQTALHFNPGLIYEKAIEVINAQ